MANYEDAFDTLHNYIEAIFNDMNPNDHKYARSTVARILTMARLLEEEIEKETPPSNIDLNL